MSEEMFQFYLRNKTFQIKLINRFGRTKPQLRSYQVDSGLVIECMVELKDIEEIS